MSNLIYNDPYQSNYKLSAWQIIQITKMLNHKKNILNKKRYEKAQLVISNFGAVLSNINIEELLELLKKIANKEIEPTILKAMNSSIEEVIRILNTANNEQASTVNLIISKLAYPQDLFFNKFEIFYNLIDREKYDLESIFKNNPKLNDGFMKKQYIQTFKTAFQNGKLHQSDVCWFIEELKKDERERVFLITHAKELINITNSPIKAIMLMENIKGIDMQEIIALASNKIDVVTQEINERYLDFPLDKIKNLTSLFYYIKEKSIEPIILKVLNTSIDNLAEIINTGDEADLIDIQNAFSQLPHLYILLQNQFWEFYKIIDKNKFNIEYLFIWNEKFRVEVREEFLNSFETELIKGDLAPNDIYFFVKELRRDKKGLDLLSSNAKKLMEITSSPIETLNLMRKYGINVSGLEEIVNSKLDVIIEKILNTVIKEYIEQFKDERLEGSFTEKEKEKISETLKLLLQDILKNENEKPTNIKRVGQGSYAVAFSIGTKVIKIGLPPRTYKIPRNCKRFLQPILRFEHDFIDEKGENYNITFNVSEKCDMSGQPTIEQLYQVYKDIRDCGMIWTDARFSNVGKLIEDNTIHYKKIEKVYQPNIGFPETKEKIEVLKKRRICSNRLRLYI